MSYLLLRTLLALSLLLALLPGHAQQQVEVVGMDQPRLQQKLLREVRTAKDSAGLWQRAKAFESWLYQNGWLEASLDSMRAQPNGWQLYMHLGPQYLLEQIELEGLAPAYKARVGLDKLEKKRAPFSWRELEARLGRCLQLFEDAGHPFAAFYDPRIDYQPAGPHSLLVRVRYRFDAGPLVRIDSIHISGNHREKDAFVYALMRLRPGSIYAQSAIEQLPRLLNNSIYYQQVEAPEVEFPSQDRAELQLRLRRRQAGKFDVLLGILPADASSQSRRLQFTGSADIVLVSPLRYGELVQLKYDKFTSSSQRLDVRLMLPYLLGTPLRVESKLFLHKQEEDFLNRYWQFAAAYDFSATLSASFYVRNKRASLLRRLSSQADTLDLVDQLGGRLNMLGGGLSYQQLDYRLTPTKGLEASLYAGTGTRKLLAPPFADSLEAALLKEQAVQELELSVKWYQPLAGRHILHLANHSYWLRQEQYFTNDLLQVGGARSIRGFNENQFFTNLYTFFSAEYRFMLERDSYIFIFGDYAYLQNSVSQEHLRPRSFGLGMRYGTRAGIISISYALGSLGRNDVRAGRGKIHIGLINQF